MLIVISISGNLYFANVEAGDRTGGVGYVCISNNEILRSLSKGDDEKIVPVGSTGTNPSPPTRGCRVPSFFVFCDKIVEFVTRQVELL